VVVSCPEKEAKFASLFSHQLFEEKQSFLLLHALLKTGQNLPRYFLSLAVKIFKLTPVLFLKA
jgi:hypothetical protein